MGRTPKHHENVRLWKTLLAEGRSRGKDAVARAAELLASDNITSDRVKRRIADGKKRYESDWQPESTLVRRKIQSAIEQFRSGKLSSKNPRAPGFVCLYLLVIKALALNPSLPRACRCVHKQLDDLDWITPDDILTIYRRCDRVMRCRFSRSERYYLRREIRRLKVPLHLLVVCLFTDVNHLCTKTS